MGIKLLGYSERGLVNSLFYELNYKDRGGRLLSLLLNQVYFPDAERKFEINEALILIEPSLSDFGDADAVLFIKNFGRKQTIFIETKVKTSQKNNWRIHDEFEEFKRGVENERVSSSNLFTQLYHKQRLIQGIREIGVKALGRDGLAFPKCSTKKGPRKIGSNPVVKKAVKRMREYRDRSFFIGVVPENAVNIRKFAKGELKKWSPGNDPHWRWQTSNWGWLTWKAVKKFCIENNLENTLASFEQNKGQIY
jgi:hypothetical protein